MSQSSSHAHTCIVVNVDLNVYFHSLYEMLYGVHFLPALGHCVCLLMYIAEHEQLRTLRVQAMKCFQTLCGLQQQGNP